MYPNSFLFHDYETFGIHPGKDRPCQFAAIRTDANLEPIGKPLEWFCQPPNDYIPQPQACLVTGITPQIAKQRGMIEADFISKVNHAFSEPGTCGVGYNSIRFDDEVTRFTLFRNFQEPYAREWKNGNSRWDLIDLVRACHALRPDGIEWPTNDDGLPSFRLEKLTQANGLSHANAHDAVSDVLATIALAKLIKTKQNRLFDYYLNLRNKKVVSELFNLEEPKPLVHVSGMFGAAQGCISWVLPIAKHPINANAIIVVDLNQNPQALLDLNAEQLHHRLYTPRSELAADELPIPVKLIHCNKSPFIATANSLSSERADELGLNRAQCRNSLNVLKQHIDSVKVKLQALFAIEREFVAEDDPACSLYHGFISNSDQQLMQTLREADPNLLSTQQYTFTDQRLNRLILPYKARNYPELLSETELRQWQAQRELSLQQQLNKIGPELHLMNLEYAQQPEKLAVLAQLQQYIEQL